MCLPTSRSVPLCVFVRFVGHAIDEIVGPIAYLHIAYSRPNIRHTTLYTTSWKSRIITIVAPNPPQTRRHVTNYSVVYSSLSCVYSPSGTQDGCMRLSEFIPGRQITASQVPVYLQSQSTHYRSFRRRFYGSDNPISEDTIFIGQTIRNLMVCGRTRSRFCQE